MIDTGGAYDEKKFSVGRQIILPFLFEKGISELDQVYLTHLDQDHAGAFESIAQEVQLLWSYEGSSQFCLSLLTH